MGVESNEVAPSFTYYNPGMYDISLIAFNDVGCTDTLFAEDYIRAFPLPVADFWMDPEETNIYQSTIEFHNTSMGAYIVNWYFGDGAESPEYDPIYTYPNAGLWPVTLTVWNNYGCKATKRDVVIVNDVFNVFVPNTFTPMFLCPILSRPMAMVSMRFSCRRFQASLLSINIHCAYTTAGEQSSLKHMIMTRPGRAM